MKTRSHVLLAGIVAAGFSLPGFSLEWAGTPAEALNKAEASQKDVIYVYAAPSMNQAGKDWLGALRNSPGLDRALNDQYVFCQIDLPVRMVKDDAVNARVKQAVNARVKQAAKHGINVLPAMVMADCRGRAYGKVVGGILESRDAEKQLTKIQAARDFKLRRDDLLSQAGNKPPGEKSPLILKALAHVPAEAWAEDYPDEMAALRREECRDPLFIKADEASRRVEADILILDAVSSLPAEPKEGKLDDLIKQFEQLAASDRLSVERKQFILISCVYPLYVRKTFLNYEGGTSGPLEESFNRSIEILETVRDMDRNTAWGQHARRIREELRAARLAAKKYD